MYKTQVYDLAYHSLGLCLREENLGLAKQDFRDGWKRLLSYYALEAGLMKNPQSAQEVRKNCNFVLNNSEELEQMFNQRDLYTLIVASDHIGTPKDIQKFKDILRKKEPFLDIDASVRMWKNGIYGKQENQHQDQTSQRFNLGLDELEDKNYDSAIGIFSGIESDDSRVMAVKELALGKAYLVKWIATKSNPYDLSKARWHLENGQKYKSEDKPHGLEALALIGAFEGGFHGPSIEGRKLKLFEYKMPSGFS